MHENKHPSTLFKYMTLDVAIKCLASNTFKWSHYRKFNDPADSYMSAVYGREDILKPALQYHAIFCVSSRKDNLPMWAHYADNHKGVVFEIDCEKFMGGFQKTNIALYRVNYEDSYPENITPIPDVAARFMNVKSPQWKYEDEYRFVGKDFLKCSNFGCNARDDGYRYCGFNASCLQGIYLGYNAEMENENLLVSLLNNVKMYECDIIRLKYEQLTLREERRYQRDHISKRYNWTGSLVTHKNSS